MDPIKKRKINENSAALTDSDAFNHITLTIDDARRILEPFTHDQLLGIVQNALLRHPDVLDAVRSLADRDTTKRKLFIRGLGWETTTEKLRALFSLYGELDEAAVILDKVTGKSKGYGFITFKHIDGAILALKEPSKPIDGRMTVTQLASAGVLGGGAPGSVGGVGGVSNSMDVSTRKIYVGNVPLDMPAERLLQVFSMYGEVEEGPLGFDKATGKSKGFALFVYKTAEAARASLLDPVKNIDGHQLNCKLASDGKRGKPPGVGAVGPMGGQGGNQSNGDGTGAMPAGQYGVQGVNGGQYGGFSSNLGANTGAGIRGQGLSTVGGQAMESNLGGSGGFGADGSHIGWPYAGGSHISGSIGTGYGGGFNGVSGGLGGNSGSLGGVGRGLGSGAGLGGGAGSGLSGHGAGLGGAGGGTTGGLGGAGSGMGAAGRESSFYSFPPSSVGMGTGDYPRSTHYSISSGGYQGLLSQPAGALPAPRLPPGGSYQGMPPYY